MEKYNESLLEEAGRISQDLEEKSSAVNNLINMVKTKSLSINKLMQEGEKEREQNKNLSKQLNELRDKFDSSLTSLENEKMEALQSLQVARQESQELLDKVKDYDQVIHKKADVTKSLEQQLQDNKELQDLVMATVEENRKLKKDLDNSENNNSVLLQEIERLRDANEYATKSITNLEDQKMQYKMSLDLTRKESGELVMDYENLKLNLQNLQNVHENLLKENMRLEKELLEKSYKLQNAIHSNELSRRESEAMIDRLQQSEGSKENELSRLREAFQMLSSEKLALQEAFMENSRDMDNLREENEKLAQKCNQVESLQNELIDLKKAFTESTKERTEEFDRLYNTLENKIEENKELMERIKSLETKQASATNVIHTLQDEKMMTRSKLNLIKKESADLLDKIKHYQDIETEYEHLKRAHDQMAHEKKNLQNELNRQTAELRKRERENFELQSHSQNLLTYSEDLENALTGARTEVIHTNIQLYLILLIYYNFV